MFRLITKLILGTSLLSAFFPPGVPSNPPPVFTPGNVSNEPGTDGQVFTSNGDGTYTFEDAAGGSGSSIKTPDGTTTVTRMPSYNVFDYGASGSYFVSKTNGAVTAGTSVPVDAGHDFRTGQAVAIPGAGAAHALAAVTPDAPTCTIGGSSLFYRVSGNIIELLNPKKEGDFLGYGTNYNFTVNTTTDLMTTEVPLGIDEGHPVYVVTSTTLPSVASGTFAAGTAVYPRRVTDLTYSIHPTAADAIAGTNSLNFTSTGSGTHTFHVELPVKLFTTAADLPSGASEDTLYYLRRDSGSLRRWTLHDTAANAAANSGVIALADAGTGFHSLMLTGSNTVNHRIVALSEGGGGTVRSAQGATTLAMATLKANSGINLWWPLANTGGTYASGYLVYSDRGGTDHLTARLNGAPNAVKITMQAGGYTNCVASDIGKTVRYSSNDRGKLHWYDNATRTWVVVRDYDGGDTFPAASACTLTTIAPNTTSAQTAGVGAGTTTGSPEFVMAWTNGGDKDVDYDNRTLALRTGQEVQLVQVSGTPSGGTNAWCYDGHVENVAYNASAATLLAALDNIPGLSQISVATVGTTPNFTYIITFYANSGEYGLGDVPELKVFSSMTGGTPVLSVGTVVQGASYIPGDIVLEPPTSSGAFYECRSAIDTRAGLKSTLTNTRNTTSMDSHNLRWTRRDNCYSVSSPSAATADVYLGTITVSGDTLTVSPATSTNVADDTPVFHDDWPGIKATITAAITADGGSIELPQGDYECWSRGFADSEWTELGGGGTDKALYNFLSSPDASVVFNLRGSSVRWRTTRVPTTTDDTNAPNFNVNTMQFFNFGALQNFAWLNGDFIHVPMGEARGESQQLQGWSSFANTASGGGDGDQLGTFTAKDCKFWNTCKMGFLSQRGTTPKFHNMEFYGAGNQHDALFREGEFYNCHIEGIGRYCSQGLYTEDGSHTRSKSYGTDWVHMGTDGLRIRTEGFEMIGGSIHNLRPGSMTTAVRIESLAKNARFQGVNINTHGRGITIGAKNCVFTANAMRNAGFAVNADDTAINGNIAIYNDWWREGAFSTFINVTAARCTASGNELYGEHTVSTAAANTNDLPAEVTGFYLNGSGCTQFVAGANTMYCTANAIETISSFVGSASFTGGFYYSTDKVYNSNNESCRFASGNGADMTFTGVTFDSLTKSDEVWVGGTSSCKYRFKDCTFLCEFELDPALTNAANTIESCDFADATQSVDFSDAGTRIIDNDFAVEPTCTGLTRYQQGNRVAGSGTAAVSLTGSQNDYAWPTICDTLLVDANGSYSITGIVPLAKGCVVNIINVDASDTLTLSNASASSAAGNRININAGSDFVEGAGDGKQLIFTGGGTLGATEN